MAKKVDPIKFEMYSYDEFRVVDLLWKKGVKTEPSESIKRNGRLWWPDIYAPNGVPVLNIVGETVIEVKRNLSFSNINEVTSFYEAEGDRYHMVVVYFKTSINIVPERNDSKGKSLVFINYKDLKEKSKTKGETTKEKFFAKRAQKNDWKETRKEVIKKAQEAIAQDNNALFLGAGVSRSAQMPSWDELLKGLMSEVKQLKPATLEAFKELDSHVLEECGRSYLIMARYLQTAILQHDNDSRFSELIQKHLYGEKDESPLLTVLSQIVQQKKVGEVVTYNFDNLLEKNLEKLKLVDGVDFISISKEAEVESQGTLPIFHVHGIIPKQGLVDKVVFSEEEYHERYSNAFHWSNIEQLHAMSMKHCFFIGLSMVDPNLRRLLDVARKMNMSSGDNHFAFLRRTKIEKYCVSDVNKGCKYVHVSESLIDQKKQKEIYDLNYAVIESIFSELGVQVIWFEDFEKELPELVAEVFGLTKYQKQGIDDLLQQCDNKIKEIIELEDKMPKANVANLTIQNVVEFLNYKAEHGADYRKAIDEAKDMLNDLTERIKTKDFNYSDIIRLQNQVPNYNDNISGFGDFYTTWLEAIKLLLGKK